MIGVLLLTFIMFSNFATIRHLRHFPTIDRFIIAASEQNVVIHSHACHRLCVSSHLLLKRSISDRVHHDVFEVAADQDLTFSVFLLGKPIFVILMIVNQAGIRILLLVELQAKDFFCLRSFVFC